MCVHVLCDAPQVCRPTLVVVGHGADAAEASESGTGTGISLKGKAAKGGRNEEVQPGLNVLFRSCVQLFRRHATSSPLSPETALAQDFALMSITASVLCCCCEVLVVTSATALYVSTAARRADTYALAGVTTDVDRLLNFRATAFDYLPLFLRRRQPPKPDVQESDCHNADRACVGRWRAPLAKL
jgi:hypothetical protein